MAWLLPSIILASVGWAGYAGFQPDCLVPTSAGCGWHCAPATDGSDRCAWCTEDSPAFPNVPSCYDPLDGLPAGPGACQVAPRTLSCSACLYGLGGSGPGGMAFGMADNVTQCDGVKVKGGVLTGLGATGFLVLALAACGSALLAAGIVCAMSPPGCCLRGATCCLSCCMQAAACVWCRAWGCCGGVERGMVNPYGLTNATPMGKLYDDMAAAYVMRLSQSSRSDLGYTDGMGGSDRYLTRDLSLPYGSAPGAYVAEAGVEGADGVRHHATGSADMVIVTGGAPGLLPLAQHVVEEEEAAAVGYHSGIPAAGMQYAGDGVGAHVGRGGVGMLSPSGGGVSGRVPASHHTTASSGRLQPPSPYSPSFPASLGSPDDSYVTGGLAARMSGGVAPGRPTRLQSPNDVRDVAPVATHAAGHGPRRSLLAVLLGAGGDAANLPPPPPNGWGDSAAPTSAVPSPLRGPTAGDNPFSGPRAISTGRPGGGAGLAAPGPTVYGMPVPGGPSGGSGTPHPGPPSTGVSYEGDSGYYATSFAHATASFASPPGPGGAGYLASRGGLR